MKEGSDLKGSPALGFSVETEQTFLKRPQDGDEGFLKELGQDPLVVEFLGGRGLKTVQTLNHEWDERGYGIFVIKLGHGPLRQVGVCGLVDSMMDGCRELICAVAASARGQRIGSEACAAVLRWSMGQQLLPIHGRVEEENEASLKLVDGLGMRRVGLRPDESQVVFEWP